MPSEPPERERRFIFHASRTCILFGLQSPSVSACMHDRYTTLSWIIENMRAHCYSQGLSHFQYACSLSGYCRFPPPIVRPAREFVTRKKSSRLKRHGDSISFSLHVNVCCPRSQRRALCAHAQTPFAASLKAVQRSRYLKCLEVKQSSFSHQLFELYFILLIWKLTFFLFDFFLKIIFFLYNFTSQDFLNLNGTLKILFICICMIVLKIW